MSVSDQLILDLILRADLLAPLALIWLAVTVQVVGLRNFLRMTAFDFVSTVASGSPLAKAASSTDWAKFLRPVIVVSALLAAQALIAWGRSDRGFIRRYFENEPALLMHDGPHRSGGKPHSNRHSAYCPAHFYPLEGGAARLCRRPADECSLCRSAGRFKLPPHGHCRHYRSRAADLRSVVPDVTGIAAQR